MVFLYPGMFFKVSMGGSQFFQPDPKKKAHSPPQDWVVARRWPALIYSGKALGTSLQLQDMFAAFLVLPSASLGSRFLFLVRERINLKAEIPAYLEALVWIKTVPFRSISDYYARRRPGHQPEKTCSQSGRAGADQGGGITCFPACPSCYPTELETFPRSWAEKPACFVLQRQYN